MPYRVVGMKAIWTRTRGRGCLVGAGVERMRGGDACVAQGGWVMVKQPGETGRGCLVGAGVERMRGGDACVAQGGWVMVKQPRETGRGRRKRPHRPQPHPRPYGTM